MPSQVTSSSPGTGGGSSAFKDQIDAAMVHRLAGALAAAAPGYDAATFERAAVEGLGPLELKARIAHVAAALAASLPGHFPDALVVVDAVLGLPASDEGEQPGGLTGWDLWPVADWVALAGRSHPADALELLSRLTRWATGEFAIRPFIDDDPVGVHRRLEQWVRRDDEHVRRLVSEGTRPKLPWAAKLAISAERPDYAVDLLDQLVDDPSEYVRRSVSNHLNDLCRLDAGLALSVARAWVQGGDSGTAAGREWIVRRGLRTLVKAGDPDALRLLGHEPDLDLLAELAVRTATVQMGDAVEWVLTLRSRERSEHTVVIDYAIHHVRADGSTGRKVTKWTTRTLVPGAPMELVRRHGIRPITTRRYHSGRHLVEVQVNGRVVATGSFDLVV